MVRAVFLYRRDVMGRGMAATDIERGLSTAEVEERIAAGKINRNMELKTNSVKELIIENLLHAVQFDQRDLGFPGHFDRFV